MRLLGFDAEGNGFLQDVTKLHCIVTTDLTSGDVTEYGPDQIEEGVAAMMAADLLVAHNGLRYDFGALRKLHPAFRAYPKDKCWDSLVLSRLIRPNLKETDGEFNKTLMKAGKAPMGKLTGSHSIEAWGRRFGIEKVGADIEDWSQWTPYMQARCVSDMAILYRLWKSLKPFEYSRPAIDLEHRVAIVCDRITEDGWTFNEDEAQKLHVKLVAQREKLGKDLRETFGGWWAHEWDRDKNGKKTPRVFTPKRDNARYGYVANAPCVKIEWEVFNPDSNAHIERCLRKMGWEPEELTDTGQAKLDEEVLEGIAANYPEANGLATFKLLTKRIGQIADGNNAWLKLVKNGRIHGAYNPMGAVTSRASHFLPNIAQVPKNSSPFGKECRMLFYVPADWGVQLGADMSGLELRALSHYMAKYDNGVYGKLILEGDVHWENVLAMGLIETQPRDKHNDLHTLLREEGAKRFIYAFLYGAGDAQAGRIVLDCCRAARKTNPEWGHVYEKFFGDNLAPDERVLKSVGRKLKNAFMSSTAGLAKLIHTIKDIVARNGSLPGLDLRRLPIRSDHAALNTLLQSCGAILCKRWMVDTWDALIAAGLKPGWDGDFVLLGWIHDELQFAVRHQHVETLGAILKQTAAASGQDYGFRIPLESDWKVGHNWAETH